MFIGRKEEITDLLNLLNTDKQENIVIYGRRRIGKSELIKETLKQFGKQYIFYQAKETTLNDNIASLSNIITKHFNLGELTFNSLEDLFTFVFKNDAVLVIDEYPYLTALEKGLDSILQAVIDEYKNTSKTKLVLLGSYIDVMKRLNEADNPLFGRISRMMFISEMNYQDASLFYPNVDLETKVKYYSVFGGVPYYNSLIDETKTFKENVVELIIKSNSVLGDFVEMVLSKELRKLNNANAVFLLIANGKNKFNDILTSLGEQSSSAALSYVLNDLIKMDLISKTTPINEPTTSRRTYYQINDNYIDFYYRYIYNYSSARTIMAPDKFYDELINENFNEHFVPTKFEKIAKEYLIIENKLGNISPSLLEIGKYWYDNPLLKVNGEFDVVTKDKNGFIVYEVKYTNKKITNNVINKLKLQLERCNVNYYKLGFVTKSGFDLESEEKYNLITLENLYDF